MARSTHGRDRTVSGGRQSDQVPAITAHASAVFQSLILVTAANGAPVLFAQLLGPRFARPVDGGIVLRDGHPLLGRSKTWRGLAAAIVFAACTAVFISLPWQAGALAGASAMAGDNAAASGRFF